MPYYLCRLAPPRPNFMADMSSDELALMRAHVEYWRPYVEVGRVAAMGPVADPAGEWGVAIIEAGSVGEVEALQAGDPVIVSRCGFSYRNYFMPSVALRPVEPRAAVSTISP
jgi:hypothetical protein